LERKRYQSIPKTISIHLKNNGSFFMKNIPDCLSTGFGVSNGKFQDKEGDWEIGKSDRFEDFFSGWSINYSSLGAIHYHALRVRSKKGKYEIWVTVGDPDSGENVIFEKGS
jgi:hypothetical protein